MTPEGIDKLTDYQRAYWPKDWKFTATQNDIDEIKLAYMDALEEYDDAVVLRGYLASLKEWAKMPNIAQIMTAADGIAYKMQPEVTRDGYRCAACDTPWNAGRGYGREEPKRSGQHRCRNCWALLSQMQIEGFVPAEDITF